jgi:predicted transcriptional regulator
MLYKSRYSKYLEGIQTDILAALTKDSHTIESLRIKLGVNWATVRDRLQVLEDQNIVYQKRVGRVRLFYLRRGEESNERYP